MLSVRSKLFLREYGLIIYDVNPKDGVSDISIHKNPSVTQKRRRPRSRSRATAPAYIPYSSWSGRGDLAERRRPPQDPSLLGRLVLQMVSACYIFLEHEVVSGRRPFATRRSLSALSSTPSDSPTSKLNYFIVFLELYHNNQDNVIILIKLSLYTYCTKWGWFSLCFSINFVCICK